MDRPGTAPGSRGLKGQRVAILLAIHGSRARFQVLFLAHDNLSSVGEVVDPATAQPNWLETELAVNAHGDLPVGSPREFCPLFATLIGRWPPLGVQTVMVRAGGTDPPASGVSSRRSATELSALEFTPLQRRVNSGPWTRFTMLVLPPGIEPGHGGV